MIQSALLKPTTARGLVPGSGSQSPGTTTTGQCGRATTPATVAPVQTRCAELIADPGYVEDVLAKGADKAQAVAAETLARAKDAMGFLPRR